MVALRPDTSTFSLSYSTKEKARKRYAQFLMYAFLTFGINRDAQVLRWPSFRSRSRWSVSLRGHKSVLTPRSCVKGRSAILQGSIRLQCVKSFLIQNSLSVLYLSQSLILEHHLQYHIIWSQISSQSSCVV